MIDKKSNSKNKKNVVKRNIKDSVFTDLFKIKKYSLELYKSLHPEDKDVTESDLKIWDSNNMALLHSIKLQKGIITSNCLLLLEYEMKPD